MNNQPLGYTGQLIILPFDHRATFAEHLFDVPFPEITKDLANQIRDFKMLIFEAFEQSIQAGVPKESAAILVDEEYGEEILHKARQHGVVTMLTVEKSGQRVFTFEYGDKFGEHILAHQPTFAKVLIKYNPMDDTDIKSAQITNLRKVSDFCHQNGVKFLLEVLVPATPTQLQQANNSQDEYDQTVRPGLTARVIEELQKAGVEPDVWKLEGFDSTADYEMISRQVRSDNRNQVGIVVLGRGAGEKKVEEWLKLSAKVPGIIGFAVGRTIFWEAISDYYYHRITREQARQQISSHFLHLYQVFHQAQA